MTNLVIRNLQINSFSHTIAANTKEGSHMADNLYAANSPKPYSDITLPIEEKEKKQTLGSFISYEIVPLIGEVVRNYK